MLRLMYTHEKTVDGYSTEGKESVNEMSSEENSEESNYSEEDSSLGRIILILLQSKELQFCDI